LNKLCKPDNLKKKIDERDTMIMNLLVETQKYKQKVIILNNKKYRKLAKEYKKMYWEFKEIKENISDKYKKSFNSLSSERSDDQLSVGSYQYEEKPISREEHLFSTIKQERRKLIETMSPESTLSIIRKTNSQKTKEESTIKIFKNSKSNEINESITFLNYDSFWFQLFTSITFKEQR